MWRARKHLQVQRCNGVKSLKAFAEFLTSTEGKDALKHQRSDNDLQYELKHSVVTDKFGFCHVILRNEDLMKKLADTEICNVDGTFGSRANFKDCSQLLTIMVRKFEKVLKVVSRKCYYDQFC